MIKNKYKLQQLIAYLAALGLSMFTLAFVVSGTWIGNDIKKQCMIAQQTYGGDCVEALSSQLEDEGTSFRQRNLAIWAIGQIGDIRALPVLESYYTGKIPAREPYDDGISQYELKKAIHLVNGGFNIMSWMWKQHLPGSMPIKDLETRETFVISDPEDPYFSLAERIASEDDLLIVDSLSKAMRYDPTYILLVASPDNLPEERIWQIGETFKDADYYPALGIITGSTLEKAEALWNNRKLAQAGENFFGSDSEVGQQIYDPILVNLDSPSEVTPLTKETLIETLARSDYFYWARHVSSNKWSWNSESPDRGENNKLYAEDVPQNPGLVIHTPSCGSFQPWKEDSIALGFTDNGAAVYIGHTHSPFSNNFLTRKGFLIPGLTTWEEFPLGIMTQVSNSVTAKTTYNIPLHFMLGDPRIYLSQEEPYVITSDEIDENGTRTIKGTSDFSTYLSIKVDEGASYSFVSIPGVSTISTADLFFNNNLQMMDLGADKYILFLHQGGDFEIHLKEQTPILFPASDALLDTLDFSWIAIGVVYSPISIAFLVLLIILLLVKILRQKKSLKDFSRIFLSGLLISILQVGYLLLRRNTYTVSATYADNPPLLIATGAAGIFASVSSGLILVQEARKKFSRVLGWLVSIFPQLMMTLFYLGTIVYTNAVFQNVNVVPKPLWNYTSFWLPMSVSTIDLLLVMLVYKISRKAKKNVREQE